MNKVIHMTYKSPLPERVLQRWRDMNPDYQVQVSYDLDCYNYIKLNFGTALSHLFASIRLGCHKADLWRLCKLYIEGGVYADVDLVPHVVIDDVDEGVDVYTCLSAMSEPSIFQAFIICKKVRDPLILASLMSFITNAAWSKYRIYPTVDMYRCFSFANKGNIIQGTSYVTNDIKFSVSVGPSEDNIKFIPLYWFPEGVRYSVSMVTHPYPDRFICVITHNQLMCRRMDEKSGWGHDHRCVIRISGSSSFYLFHEVEVENEEDCAKYHVEYRGKNIMDSRDPDYVANDYSW
jgi:hypothetical protein